jgi:hypothetical protein
VSVSLLQKQLAQRQFIIQLWDRMANLRPIEDQTNPPPAVVHAASNTLELVGLCCEGGMIDAAVVKRTFGPKFIELYDMVKACGKIPTMQNKNGIELLRENRAAMTFYEELMNEHKASGKLLKT